MTYYDLITLEPRIAAVLDRLRPAPPDCNQYIRYEAVKRELSGLVGYGAFNPTLATPSAYDCAIQEVARRLEL